MLALLVIGGTTVAPAGAAVSVPLRINAGGPAYTDPSGNVWQADKAYSSGSWGYDTSYGTTSTSHAIAGTTTPTPYQTANTFNNNTGYKIDIANGTYSVTLKMLEDWANQAGQRKFDVTIEGVKVLTAFDIFASCGAYTACDRTFTTTVSDGQLNIQFTMDGGANYGTVSAIQVTASGSSDTTPPSAPTSLTSPSHTSSSVALSWGASTDNVGVTGYRVYRNGTQVGTPTGTTFTDSGLTASTTYTYTVKAADAAGNLSAASNSLNVTTSAATGDTTPPSAPANLASPSHTSSAVALSWSASTDNVGVTGYRVYRNGTQVGTPTATSFTDTGLAASTTYTYTVKAIDAAGNLSAASNSLNATTSAATTGGSYPLFASYIDITLGHPLLQDVMSATGQHDFKLAFVLGSAAGCDPEWGAQIALNDPTIVGEINAVKAAGGRVIVSFGGAAGPYLETSCSSQATLAAAYEKVIDTLGIHDLDIDIEASINIDMVNKALAQVQRDRPGTTVSYTLMVQASSYGLNPALGTSVLTNAVANGVNVTMVNPMVMDFGQTQADWGDDVIMALQATYNQMTQIWPGLSSATLHKMLGATPMIGKNDTGPVFSLADGTKLVSWANTNHIGNLGFWSVARDNGGCSGVVSPTCSGIAQSTYQFTSIFRGFTG
jgi:chitodextrinase